MVRARACSVRGRAGPQRSTQSTVALVTGSIEGGPHRIPVDGPTSLAASRRWWDADSDDYQREHEGFLGAASWIWGPEGWDDEAIGLLRARPGDRVLEFGCGAAAGARWLRSTGIEAIGLDLSHGMLQHSRRIDDESGTAVPTVQADAAHLPFCASAFDVVGSAYGALPFVADASMVFAEVHRVLVPGGRAVLGVSHPIRWAFPDDPGEGGLTAAGSYFDRTPYVEADDDGQITYVEHHRTIGDWVDLVVGSGLALTQLIEPEWRPGNESVWAGWSPLRGALLPGTLILVATKPAAGTRHGPVARSVGRVVPGAAEADRDVERY